MSAALIIAAVVFAIGFVIAVARLFSPTTRETTDGDIVSSTADVGHDGGGDGGGGD